MLVGSGVPIPLMSAYALRHVHVGMRFGMLTCCQGEFGPKRRNFLQFSGDPSAIVESGPL